jgi:hypothetical protein
VSAHTPTLVLPLRVESAESPLDMHFVMEHGSERMAVAFGSERAKLDAVVRACNSHDALVAALAEISSDRTDRVEDVRAIALFALRSVQP